MSNPPAFITVSVGNLDAYFIALLLPTKQGPFSVFLSVLGGMVGCCVLVGCLPESVRFGSVRVEM